MLFLAIPILFPSSCAMFVCVRYAWRCMAFYDYSSQILIQCIIRMSTFHPRLQKKSQMKKTSSTKWVRIFNVVLLASWLRNKSIIDPNESNFKKKEIDYTFHIKFSNRILKFVNFVASGNIYVFSMWSYIIVTSFNAFILETISLPFSCKNNNNNKNISHVISKLKKVCVHFMLTPLSLCFYAKLLDISIWLLLLLLEWLRLFFTSLSFSLSLCPSPSVWMFDTLTIVAHKRGGQLV